MSGCGYVCPACNGLEMDEQGNKCSWCSPIEENSLKPNISDEEWIKSVHEGSCCSDPIE